MGDIQQLLIMVPIFILSISFHEAAHAYSAFYFGDDTAQKQGRLTLNPLSHLDPLGTLVLVLFHFGWAKPVPVDPRNLKNPDRDMSAIAAAGPLSNLALAVFCVVVIQLVKYQPALHPMINALVIGAWINVMLFIFNLIPVPPLDGGNIIRGFLPSSAKEVFDKIAPYSMLILIVMIYLPFTRQLLTQSIGTVLYWIELAFSWI